MYQVYHYRFTSSIDYPCKIIGNGVHSSIKKRKQAIMACFVVINMMVYSHWEMLTKKIPGISAGNQANK